MKKIFLLLVLFGSIGASAQVVTGGVIYVSTAPSGTCLPNSPMEVVVGSGTAYTCQNNSWAQAGGGGTVTGVTAGTGITVSGSPPSPTVAVTNPLPTGVAAGSACVSNGVGLPCAYQSKPVIDVRDFPGASVGAQIDNACAWLSGAQGTVLIPASVGAGSSIAGLPSNCFLEDYRSAAFTLTNSGLNVSRTNNYPASQGGTASNFFKGVWYTPITGASQNVNAIEAHQTCLAGMRNFNSNGFFKDTCTTLYSELSSYTPAQVASIFNRTTCYSVGDCLPLVFDSFFWGGRNANGDEGSGVAHLSSVQGNCQYQGGITSGGSTGSISLTIGPTAGCDGTQGAYRFLQDTQAGKTYSTGTIASITNNPNTDAAVYVGSSTAWTASTANTTTTSAILSAAINTSTTVTISSATGVTNGAIACIADAQTFEQITVTNITSTTVTLTPQKAHASGSYFTIGGTPGCGWGIKLTADDYTPAGDNSGYTPNLISRVFPVVAVTDGTHLKVWDTVAGGWGQVVSTYNAAGTNTYVAYPIAEVSSVLTNGALSETFTLFPNTAPFANTDTIALPQYPAEGGATVLVQQFRSFPGVGASNNNTSLMDLQMGGQFYGGQAFRLTNSTLDAYYGTAGGQTAAAAPNVFTWNTGIYNEFLFAGGGWPFYGASLFDFSGTGCGKLACSARRGIYKDFASVGNASDLISYQPSTGDMLLTFGGQYHNLVLDGANNTVADEFPHSTPATLGTSSFPWAGITLNGLATGFRYSVDTATTLVTTDFAISGGWGSTASKAITITTSKDSAFVITLTSSGTGQAANPTIALTFHDGTWTNVPACVFIQTGGTGIFGDSTVSARSATAYTWIWNATPTTAATYEFTGHCTGT